VRKKSTIKTYSEKQIKNMAARGASHTDWARVNAMAQDEVERLADQEEGPLVEGWERTAFIGLPPAKKEIHIRLDEDILDWFRAQGARYQTRINAVLRSFVQAQQQTRSKS
jgi:uncharacterized protein (DUF4415 family)